MSNMLLLLIWLPASVVFGFQYVVQLRLLYSLQQQCSAIVDNAAELGATDIDWQSFLSNTPALSIPQSQADVATTLAAGFATVTALAGPGYSGLSVWVGNPGQTDPFTGQVAALPTVHVKGTVRVDALGNGNQTTLHIDQGAVADSTR
ncbi:MAG: hypothetical protein KGJ86_11195 [Chloroflexota bacterium]|nr:hypothetical protein [Chloroflexota bacterium]